jgi:hypothetical protein
MIKKSFLTALLSASLLLGACKKNPTVPEPEPVSGRRDYVWQLDTLDMPMNWIDAVWGASPNDVWAVGAGGTYQDRLLHYDGVKWSTYNKEPIWCTGNTLFGFSANNVWMGGGAGWLAHGAGIWHYDGAKWSQYYVYDIEGSYLMKVQDMWGTAPDDIYASGVIVFKEGQTDVFRGFVLHFDGKRWAELARAQFVSQFLTVRKERNKVYLFSSARHLNENYEFYELNGNEMARIYSGRDAYSLHTINGKSCFVIGSNVYTYVNGGFVEHLSIDDENFGYQIYGRNEKDLFLRMKDGLAHYNGTDVEYLYSLPQNNISIMKNAVLFEREVFFCVRSYADSRNLIIHGMLNE